MPFTISKQSDYWIVSLQGDCSGSESPNLNEEIVKESAENPPKFILFQCGECRSISAPFMKQMTAVANLVALKNGSVRLVGPTERVATAVKGAGLERILPAKQSLRGALADLGLAPKNALDMNFINPFLTATQKVFEVQCSLPAKPLKPFLKKPLDPALLGDVSGIISISSETFNGTLAISLPETVFCHLVKSMLSEECTEVTDANVDLVGELANMILGGAKTELRTLGYAIQMVTPSCIWGKGHKIKHFGHAPCIVLPFETSAGVFYAEIMTQPLANELRKTS